MIRGADAERLARQGRDAGGASAATPAPPRAEPRPVHPPPDRRARLDRRGRHRRDHRDQRGGRRRFGQDRGRRLTRRQCLPRKDEGQEEVPRGRVRQGPQRHSAAWLEAPHRPGPDPRVPRPRPPARRRAVPRTLRRPHRLQEADGLARRTGLPGGDARTGAGSLVPRRHAAAEADRHLLRRRLPPPVHLRPADPPRTRLGGPLEPQGRRLRTVRIERQGDDRGGLGWPPTPSTTST